MVTVLGSSGAYPTLSNPCSSVLVELNGFRILLDADDALAAARSTFDGEVVLASQL